MRNLDVTRLVLINRLRKLSINRSDNISNDTATTPKRPTKHFNEIPGPKPLPLIGNLWRYLPIIGDYKPDALYKNAQFNKKHYGPIVREVLTKKHAILHLFDPNDIETFFRQDGKYPHRRSHRALLKYRQDLPEFYQDGGLFPENGPNWQKQRNQFQQYLMSKSNVSSNIGRLDEISLTIVNRIATELSVNEQKSITFNEFESILYRWALENSLSVFLDLNLDKLDEEYIQEFIQQLHNTLIALEKTEIQTEKWIKHPNKCTYYQMLANSQDFLYKFVSQQIDQALAAPSKDTSYIRDWILVDKLDRRDVVSFVIDSLMAGLHTTAYTIAHLFYHISQNKDILKSLQAEIGQNLPKDGNLTINHIDKLSLMRDCLKETMRLSPVSIGTGRVTQDTVTIRDYKIPKGSMIIAQTQAISKDETIYSESDKFKPERWSHYRACPKLQRPSAFASLPFGFGARACIGQRLAELQIKILAARLLQRFNIQVDEFKTKTVLVHTIDGHINARIEPIVQ